MNNTMNEVAINAGCLLFFADAISHQDREDVFNSTLYAQLAASKKHQKFSTFGGWSKTFLQASIEFGWRLNANEKICQPMASRSPGSVWDWIKKALPVFVSASDINQGEALARQRYRDHPDHRAVSLFAEQVLEAVGESASRLTAAALQIGFVGPMSTMTLIQIKFITRQPLQADFLFEPMMPNDIVENIELSFYSMELRELVYSQFRDTFSTLLENTRSELVCPLKGDGDVQQ